ncbi:cupredoxin domain-containing protein [Paracoccus niistensis]|uniref:Plastocyanin-like domain-containing protein n=1 Tax=Paracoccus niistensis TaxID=632935 RepID=A0ABV6I313_9RHOB
MTMNRRWLIPGGAAMLLAAQAPRRLGGAARPLLIEMKGSPRGERVAFVPVGLAVAPGATIRFVNRDAGNSHAATAYHPDILDRLRRIPDTARPWDSGLLLPDEEFEVTLTIPGSTTSTASRMSMPAWWPGSLSADRTAIQCGRARQQMQGICPKPPWPHFRQSMLFSSVEQ